MKRMISKATTIDEYLESLAPDRREGIDRLRQTIRQNLDPRFAEEMSYGMIGYVVPKSIYPAGYHANHKLPLPFMNLGNQKNYIVLHHLGLYADPVLLKWFEEEYEKTGFKLDMGKGCVRFKKAEQIPYELIGRLAKKVSLDQYVERYQELIRR